jgi:hypothetical protein
MPLQQLTGYSYVMRIKHRTMEVFLARTSRVHYKNIAS